MKGTKKSKAKAAAKRFGGAIQVITKKPEGLRGIPERCVRIRCECCGAKAEMPFRFEANDEKYIQAFRRDGWDLWSKNKRAKCSACARPVREEAAAQEAA